MRLFWHGPGPARRTRIAVLAVAGMTLTWWCFVSVRLSSSGNSGRSGRILPAAADDTAVCRQYGWAPYRSPPGPRPRPRKVYDLLLVSDELDWLEVRLNTTFAEVDHYVLVEAPLTFTGLPKPLVLRDHWARFAPYHAKLLYHTLVYPAGFAPRRAWDREDLQRNALLLQALQDPALPADARPQDGDVLVVADVDEIPRPAALRALRRCRFPRRLTLQGHFYYYGFQFRHRGPDWPHPQATTYAGGSGGGGSGDDNPGGTLLPVALRNGDLEVLWPGNNNPVVRVAAVVAALLRRWWDQGAMPSAAWHCSSCYATLAELLHKLESVSHVWMNHPLFRDRDRAADHVRRGCDLWDRAGEVYDRVENNTDVPPVLLAEPARYQYLLSRDGESAGFRDYP